MNRKKQVKPGIFEDLTKTPRPPLPIVAYAVGYPIYLVVDMIVTNRYVMDALSLVFIFIVVGDMWFTRASWARRWAIGFPFVHLALGIQSNIRFGDHEVSEYLKFADGLVAAVIVSSLLTRSATKEWTSSDAG